MTVRGAELDEIEALRGGVLGPARLKRSTDDLRAYVSPEIPDCRGQATVLMPDEIWEV